MSCFSVWIEEAALERNCAILSTNMQLVFSNIEEAAFGAKLSDFQPGSKRLLWSEIVRLFFSFRIEDAALERN